MDRYRAGDRRAGHTTWEGGTYGRGWVALRPKLRYAYGPTTFRVVFNDTALKGGGKDNNYGPGTSRS